MMNNSTKFIGTLENILDLLGDDSIEEMYQYIQTGLSCMHT